MFQLILSTVFLTYGKINLNNKPFTLKSQLIEIKQAIKLQRSRFPMNFKFDLLSHAEAKQTSDISRETNVTSFLPGV